MRHVTANGINMIASFEGFVDHPYNDPANATIGFGHLIHFGRVTHADLARWGHISRRRGLILLRADLAIAETTIWRTAPHDIPPHRRDALVSLVFNCGAAPMNDLVGHYVHRRDWHAAGHAMLAWCHDDHGNIVPGLLDRRRVEAHRLRNAW